MAGRRLSFSYPALVMNITLCLDYRPLLQQKVRDLSQNYPIGGVVSSLGSIEGHEPLNRWPKPLIGSFQPKNNSYVWPVYEQPWLVHGRRLQECTGGLHIPHACASLEEWYTLLLSLAESVEWALIPFGGMRSYACCAFITKSDGITEAFAKHGWVSTIHFGNIDREINLLLAQWKNESCIYESGKAVIFKEPWGYVPAWEFVAQGGSPWVVNEGGTLPTDDATILQCELNNGVYARKPASMTAFAAMKRGGSGYVFPGCLAINAVAKLVHSFENPQSYSELTTVSESLLAAEWFYLYGREHVDTPTSLFGARNMKSVYKCLFDSGTCEILGVV